MSAHHFHQLAIFQVIVAQGSIHKAATALGMSGPSVSKALKVLEMALGIPLFIRTTRRLELTAAGRQLYDQSHKPMADLQNALESASDHAHTPQGTVRLTVPRFVYQLFLKPIFAEFCRLYPEILLEISVSDRAVDLIKEGFDLGIRFGHQVAQDMVARPLSPMIKDALFASPAYIERYGQPRTLEELAAHKLIQYRFVASNSLAPLEVMGAQGQKIRVEMPSALIVNDTDALIDAGLAGLGIGRILAPIITPYLETGQLVAILPDHWPEVSGLSLYFPQQSQKARRVRVLVDYLMAHQLFQEE